MLLPLKTVFSSFGATLFSLQLPFWSKHTPMGWHPRTNWMAEDDLCWRTAAHTRCVPQLEEPPVQSLVVDGAVGGRLRDEMFDCLHSRFSMSVRLGVVWC